VTVRKEERNRTIPHIFIKTAYTGSQDQGAIPRTNNRAFKVSSVDKSMPSAVVRVIPSSSLPRGGEPRGEPRVPHHFHSDH